MDEFIKDLVKHYITDSGSICIYLNLSEMVVVEEHIDKNNLENRLIYWHGCMAYIFDKYSEYNTTTEPQHSTP